MGFRFQRLDPTNPFGGARRYLPLTEPFYQAAIRFGSARSAHESHWTKPEARLIEESIDAIEVIIEAQIARCAVDEGDPIPTDEPGGDFATLGGSFIDVLQTADDEKVVVSVKLPDGRTLRVQDMLAALAMRQCETAAAAIDRRNTQAVAFLMWDIHELIVELLAIEDWHDSESALSNNARRAAHARHAEHRAMREQVRGEFLRNPQAYPSKDAAAEAMAGKLVPMPFRTVRDWLKGC